MLEIPQLDLSKLRFPSDSITLGQMRADDPALFSKTSLEGLTATHVEAIATHWWEQMLARKAFSKAAGMPDLDTGTDMAFIVSTLNSAYRKYGLSSGMHQTRELAREIEIAAASQVTSRRKSGR